MLFISPNPAYLITGVNQKPIRDTASGQIVDYHGGTDIEFRHGRAPQWAEEEALANPKFQQAWGGLPDGVDYRSYIACYDTEQEARAAKWDDETKHGIEQFLLNWVDYGNRYILVEPPLAITGKPWPNYDQTHHFQIVKVAKEIGIDPVDVLEYERRNKNRDSVVSALEAEIGDVEELVAA